MISAELIPLLQQRYPNRGLLIGSRPCATFPAIHPNVGDVIIYDDGDELTVVAGNFTHGHFSNYDKTLSLQVKESQIVQDVINFLDALFSDRVVLWGSHKGGGGWYYPEFTTSPRHEMEYIWSGPRSKA